MALGFPWISCVALSNRSRMGIGVQPSFQPSTHSSRRTTSEELTLMCRVREPWFLCWQSCSVAPYRSPSSLSDRSKIKSHPSRFPHS